MTFPHHSPKLADLAANELPRMVPMSSHLLVSSTQYSQHKAWSKSRTQDQNLVGWSIFNSKSLPYQLPNSEHCCCSCPSWASTPEATRPRKIAQPLDPHLHPPAPRKSDWETTHTYRAPHSSHLIKIKRLGEFKPIPKFVNWNHPPVNIGRERENIVYGFVWKWNTPNSNLHCWPENLPLQPLRRMAWALLRSDITTHNNHG